MEDTLKSLIIGKIEEEGYEAFSCYDFLDFGVYKTISKCLERMEDNGEIRRVIPGIYDLNHVDKFFGETPSPNIDAVAKALAREYMWDICPTGSMALNMFGISSQVSASFTYLSSGPYRDYQIGNVYLKFKHTSNREISTYSGKTSILIQAIKEIGEDNLTTEILIKIKNHLSKKEKETALLETKNLTTWIRNIIVDICQKG